MKTKIPHLILAGLFGTTLASQAATVTWDAGVNTTWDTTTANWTGSTYTNGDDVQFLGAGAGTVTTSGTISPGSILVNSSANYIVNGTISGSGSLVKDGSGNLRLSGANTYTGATNINDGTLWLGNGGPGGSLNTASAINIASGATFRTKQTDDITQGSDFSGAAITGDGGITHDPGGTLILNAANEHAGGTFLFGSTVRAEHSDALGTGTVTLWNTAKLELADGIDVGNTLSVANAGNNKTLQVDNAGPTSATYSGNITINEAGANNFDLIAGDNDTLTISGDISGNGAAGITKTGLGTVVLSGTNNTYTGGTTIGEGSNQSTNIIAAGNDSAFGTGTITTLGAGIQGVGAARTFSNDLVFGAGGGGIGLLHRHRPHLQRHGRPRQR